MDSATLIEVLIDGVLQGRPLPSGLIQEMRANARLFDIIFPEPSQSQDRPLPSFESTFLKSEETAPARDHSCQ